MQISMISRPKDLVMGLLTVFLMANPNPLVSDVGFWGDEVKVREAGAILRPDDKIDDQPVTLRGRDEYRQPVDRACDQVTDLVDGPASGVCHPRIEVVEGVQLVMEKSSSTLEITGPGTVTYEYLLRNDGGQMLTGIEVIDNHVDAPPVCPFTSLPPGQTDFCTAAYTVTTSDIQAGGSPVPGSGVLENIATATSLEGAFATAVLAIPYNITPGPDPLVLEPVDPELGSIVEGREEQIEFSATGGTPPYDFSGGGAPPGMSFQQNGSSFFLEGSPQQVGDFLITVALSDAMQNTVERTYSLTVVGELVLLPPGGPLPDAVVNQSYEAIFSIEGGQEPYGFTVAGLPEGLSLSLVGSQLRLTGTPTQTGEFIIQITASDSSTPSQFASETYSLSVAQDMTLTPPGPVLPDAVLGQPYEFVFMIEGGTPPFEFQAEAPPGLAFTLDGRQLTLSGVPEEAGEFPFGISVTDSSPEPQSAADDYLLRVAPELLLLPEDPILPVAQVGEAYSTTFTAAGGRAPVQLSGVGAPPGLQFELVNDELVLSGIPNQIGEYVVSVTAQDASSPQQLVARDYQLSVVLRLELAPQTLPLGVVGEDYLAVLSVLNGIPPFTFETSALPSGLSLTSNAISGQPGEAGDFAVSVTATDAQGNTGSLDYVLTVLPAGLVIIGESLPDAYLDLAYGARISAIGAPTPISWSGGGGLPPGLVLSSTGFVNGFAQQVGDFGFEATATAADGQVATGTFSVRVLPQEPITVEPLFPPGLVGTPYETPTAVRGGTPPYDCVLLEGVLPPGLVLNGCNAGIDGTPLEIGTYSFSLGIMDGSAPPLVSEISGTIQVAESTPIADPQPPDLDFQQPYKVPVAETSLAAPAPGFADESLQGLTVDAWGNRYVVGFSYNGTDYDIRVQKYSADGRLLWDQAYDSGSQDYGYGITVSESEQAVYASGYSLVGNRYEAVLIRYDLVGVEQWVVRNGGTSQVVAFYGLASDESGVFAVGERYNGSNFDAVAAYYSHSGDLEWETVRPTQASRTAYAAVLAQCGNAGCLLVGGAQGPNGESGWVEQFDPLSGAASPLATVGGGSVVSLQASNDGVIAGGSTAGNDWIVTAMTFGGQSQWSVTLSSGDRLRGVDIDRSGFVYAAGSGSGGNDGLLALISPDGSLLGETTYDEGASEAFHGVVVGPEGLITTAGQRVQTGGNRFLLVNFDSGKAP